MGIVNKGLFFSFIHPKVFNFLSGAENKVTITVFLSRKKSKSSKTGRLIEGRCVQVSLCCIKLFDENALSLNFSPFLGGEEETRTVYFGPISRNLSYFHLQLWRVSSCCTNQPNS